MSARVFLLHVQTITSPTATALATPAAALAVFGGVSPVTRGLRRCVMVTVIRIFGTLVIVALFIVAVIVMLMMAVLIPRPFKTTGSRLAEVSVG